MLSFLVFGISFNAGLHSGYKDGKNYALGNTKVEPFYITQGRYNNDYQYGKKLNGGSEYGEWKGINTTPSEQGILPAEGRGKQDKPPLQPNGNNEQKPSSDIWDMGWFLQGFRHNFVLAYGWLIDMDYKKSILS